MLPMLLALGVSAQAGTEDGRATYVAKCQACHGATGKGDGPASRALPKKPRDFSVPEFWAAYDDATVQTAITQGLPGTIMRGFPMAPPQLTDLVAYMRTLIVTPPVSP